MSIISVLSELRNFSGGMLHLGAPVDEKEILQLEGKFNVLLPEDYKALLKEHNGLSLLGTEIYGIENTSFSLQECYNFEHYEVENPMPLYLIPFSPDGAGNHYCFDTRINKEGCCPIVFWQHDYAYTVDDEPEMVNSNLEEWIREVMIEWTLEHYDYDGTEK